MNNDLLQLKIYNQCLTNPFVVIACSIEPKPCTIRIGKANLSWKATVFNVSVVHKILKMNPYLLFIFGLVLPVAYTVGPRCVSYYLKLFLFYLSLLVNNFRNPYLFASGVRDKNGLSTHYPPTTRRKCQAQNFCSAGKLSTNLFNCHSK